MPQLNIPPGTNFNDLPDDSIPAPIEKPDPIHQLLQDFKLDYTRPLPPPPIAIEVNGGIFGTLGNFSLVIGKAKSKKTFLITLAMAAAINSGDESGVFIGKLPPDKNRVIFIDTEQGEYQVNKVARRVLRLIGADTPPNFDAYHLRGADTRTRHQIISYLIEYTPDLGLLIIDGIRDVVTSINDEEQATSITNDLLRWTEQKQIHIITVLHQNKGDSNARGHLGTELINKAENTLSVTVEPDNREVSKVEAEYSKHKEFTPFAFIINDDGLPEKIDGWKPKAADRPKNQKYDPSEITDHQHYEVLRVIQQNAKKPNYTEMVKQIRYAVSEKIQSIGTSKAEAYLTYYKNNKYIRHHGSPGTASAYYDVDLTQFSSTTLPP